MDAAKNRDKVLTQSRLAAGKKDANVHLYVYSTFASPVRTTVMMDEALALDVELPGVPRHCTHEPTFLYELRLPHGRTTVTAQATDLEQVTTQLRVTKPDQWLVLVLQDGVSNPLSLKVWKTEPRFG